MTEVRELAVKMRKALGDLGKPLVDQSISDIHCKMPPIIFVLEDNIGNFSLCCFFIKFTDSLRYSWKDKRQGFLD